MQCLEEEEEEEEEEEGEATAAVAAHLPPPTPPLLQLRCAHVGRASTQPSRAPGLSACCLLFDCVNCKLKSSKACGCRRRPVDSAYDAPADSAYDAPAHATRHSSALKLVRDASIFNAVADLRCSRICFCKLRQQCSQLLAGLPLLHILLLSVSSIPNSAQPPPPRPVLHLGGSGTSTRGISCPGRGPQRTRRHRRASGPTPSRRPR